MQSRDRRAAGHRRRSARRQVPRARDRGARLSGRHRARAAAVRRGRDGRDRYREARSRATGLARCGSARARPRELRLGISRRRSRALVRRRRRRRDRRDRSRRDRRLHPDGRRARPRRSRRRDGRARGHAAHPVDGRAGRDLPRVIGHFNFWPLVREPSQPRAGAPWDELIEPGTLFDRMAPLVGDGGMMMLNHPWGDPLFGRDTGYLRAIKLDPRVPLDTRSPLMKRPSGQHRNMDWTIIEIINGGDMSELMQARTLWHSLLAQGYIAPGAGNSDSHGMTDDQLGWARNWVEAPTQVVGFNPNVLNDAIRDGRMIAGNGVVVLVEVGPPAGPRRGLGFTPYRAQPGDVIDITVQAAPWIPLHEVRVVTSKGTQTIAMLPRTANPFGTETLRYHEQIPLASLVDKDDFIIVEAGLTYPLAADLDDDGVLDTTDNNGDGVVDKRDVEEGEDVGPLQAPAEPTDASDQRFLITRIVRNAWPEGFTNPLFIDVDGNGWTPPGLP